MTFRLPVLGLDDSNFPSDGQVLSYNTAQNKFEWINGGGSNWTVTSNVMQPAVDGDGVLIDVPTTTREALILKTTDDNATKNIFEVQKADATVLASMSALGKLTVKGDTNYNEGLSVAPGINGGYSVTLRDPVGAIRGYILAWTGGQVTMQATSILELQAGTHIATNNNLFVGGYVTSQSYFWIGAVAYATAGTPIKDSEAAMMTGYAWNGSNGYTLRSDVNLWLTKDDDVMGNGTLKCSISDYNLTQTPVVWQVNQDGTFTHIINNSAAIGLIVKGAASQSVNLQEWQSSVAGVLAYVNQTGGALFSDKVQFTQTDGNEYIDSLNDGYMDYRATTAHRFGDGTNQISIAANGNQTFAGTAGFYPRTLNQSAAPAAGTGATQCDTGELIVWEDADNTETWLVYNRNGTVKGIKVENI